MRHEPADRIELLAALVQRKWRELQKPYTIGPRSNLEQEWAAASLLLELAQESQTRSDGLRDLLVQICKPTSEI